MPEAVVSARPGPSSPSAVTLSVIIPAYQVARYIGASIESVLHQTHDAKEIVVCDDGSTDDLDRALAPFRDHITLVRQENRGVAAAYNAAAAVAGGEFVVILDPDDLFLPTRLERLAQLAVARPDLDILTTDAFVEYDGVPLGRYYTATNRFEVADQRRGVLRANFLFGLLAVRRTSLMAIGGFDESIVSTSDWECWIRLILSGARAGLVDEPLAVYRLRDDSLSGNRPRLLRGRVTTLGKTLQRDDLSLGERRVAEGSLALARRMLALTEAQEALVQRAPDARSQLLRIAFGEGYSLRSRTKAAMSAIAPNAATAHLSRRKARRAHQARSVRAARE